jgi:hypothetical protein
MARIPIAAERYALVTLFGGAALVAVGGILWPDLTSRTPLPLCLVVAGMFAMNIGLALTLGRQPVDGRLPAPTSKWMAPSTSRTAVWQVGRPLLQVLALVVFINLAIAFGQSRVASMAIQSKGMAMMAGIIAAVAGFVIALTLMYAHREWRKLARLACKNAFAAGTVEEGTLVADTSYYRKKSKQTTVSYVDGMRQESTSTAHWLEGSPHTAGSDLVIRVADGSRVTVRADHWLARVRFHATEGNAAMRTIAQIAPGDRVRAVRLDAKSPVVVFGPLGWTVFGWYALWWLVVIASLSCGVVAITA